MKVLITGGCGFIGHHFIEHFLKNTDWEVATLDKLTYASFGFERLRDISVYDEKRVQIFTSDLTREITDGLYEELKDVEYIFHLAAETHVDNSITNPEPFVMSNVIGTMHILNFARKLKKLKAFHYFSTDEIFGPALRKGDVPQEKKFKYPMDLEIFDGYAEWDRYNSTNPYSAAKAGGEELCLAWANTYGLPLFITHTMNCFGERQHPEKFIPKCIRAIQAGEKMTIHADSTKERAGTRYYIHCRNVADAIIHLLPRFEQREKYNVVGEKEVSNLALAQFIADVLGKPLYYEMVDFHSSRPGHDLRYALNGAKMMGLGWRPPITFEESLERTVLWTLERPRWLML